MKPIPSRSIDDGSGTGGMSGSPLASSDRCNCISVMPSMKVKASFRVLNQSFHIISIDAVLSNWRLCSVVLILLLMRYSREVFQVKSSSKPLLSSSCHFYFFNYAIHLIQLEVLAFCLCLVVHLDAISVVASKIVSIQVLFRNIPI